MMSWDKVGLAQKFLRMANGIHPDPGDDDYLAMLARQEVYDQCYMASFSRDSLEKFFQAAANGDVELPEEILEERDAFKVMFIKQASKVKDDLIREGVL